MIIVPVKDGENIERALKKFKRKFEKTGVVKELRARQQYDKPSVLKRLKMEHAIYVQQYQDRGGQAPRRSCSADRSRCSPDSWLRTWKGA